MQRVKVAYFVLGLRFCIPASSRWHIWVIIIREINQFNLKIVRINSIWRIVTFPVMYAVSMSSGQWIRKIGKNGISKEMLTLNTKTTYILCVFVMFSSVWGWRLGHFDGKHQKLFHVSNMAAGLLLWVIITTHVTMLEVLSWKRRNSNAKLDFVWIFLFLLSFRWLTEFLNT